MSHDPSKVLMGTTLSNIRDVDNRVGEIEAGLVARLKSDGTLSILASDGAALGISLGKDLSNGKRSAVARSGLGVPLLLTSGFTPVVGAQVFVSDTTGKGGASGAGFTGMNAIYASPKKTAVREGGAADLVDQVAYVDMVGGL